MKHLNDPENLKRQQKQEAMGVTKIYHLDVD